MRCYFSWEHKRRGCFSSPSFVCIRACTCTVNENVQTPQFYVLARKLKQKPARPLCAQSLVSLQLLCSECEGGVYWGWACNICTNHRARHHYLTISMGTAASRIPRHTPPLLLSWLFSFHPSTFPPCLLICLYFSCALSLRFKSLRMCAYVCVRAHLSHTTVSFPQDFTFDNS